MRVTTDKAGVGVWLFQCMKCGITGSAIDAVVKLQGKTTGEAINILKAKLGIAPGEGRKEYTRSNGIRQPQVENYIDQRNEKIEDEPYPEPKLNLERAQKFIDTYHQRLMNSDRVIDQYLVKKRGISTEVAARHKLGFIDDEQIEWVKKDGTISRWRITAAWVLPICNERGELRAVKLHCEIPQKKSDGTSMGKSMWMMFGTTGVHSFNGFWPHPYVQVQQMEGINFSGNSSWWVNRLPEGSLKNEWRQKLDDNKWLMSNDLGVHPDEYTAKELEAVFQQTFNEMRKEIHKEVLKSQQKETASTTERVMHGWTVWAPGELKALATVSAGMIGTSLTGGEHQSPRPHMLRCFRGRRVALMYDHDLPHELHDKAVQTPGQEWAHKMTKLLCSTNVLEVRVFTGGRESCQPKRT